MRFVLMEVSGLAQAIMTLKMSKRNWSMSMHEHIMSLVDDCTDKHGFILDNLDQDKYNELIENLNKVAKYGAGYDQSAMYDEGHDTLLRFIDLTFVTIGLHRGAQDDLDAHAKRFDSRIVRESTRLATFGTWERSEWYQDKIRSVGDIADMAGIEIPNRYQDESGVTWVKTHCGYVREDLQDDKDALRGNYPMSIPSNAIWKINLYDARHVYMRRNMLTHANPELKSGIEMLADQVQERIPGDLGKVMKYQYALKVNPDGSFPKKGEEEYVLTNPCNIRKVYVP